MRIATWPVNGVNARKDYLRHWLTHREPDIVALQKTSAFEERFPLKVLDAAGYLVHAYRSPNAPRDYGVAVLSRKELDRPIILDKGLPGQADASARLLTLKVGDLVISSIYAPYGNPTKNGQAKAVAIRAAWLKCLRMYVRECLAGWNRVLLCGDFNVSNPQAARNREDARQLAQLVEAGFVDLYPHRHPDKSGNTYGWDLHRPPTSRLSRILGTRSVASTLLNVCVDLDYRKAIPGHGTWTKSAPLIVDIE